MDLSFSPAEEAFRQEVRGFIDEKFTPDMREALKKSPTSYLDPDRQRVWQKALYEKGWAAPKWPEEYGGTGWTAVEHYIYETEISAAGAPRPIGFGARMVGPVIVQFGRPDQKERFLPRILSFDDWWCQGYSEPGAGSDLANVQTRAEREGDDFVIHGQKVWTSGAEWSDWCFVLCRTDPEAQPKHRGLSYILCPMDQSGIEVRPIVQMTGDAEFSEVFFNDARTSAENVVGDVNGGWKVTNGTLLFERGVSTLGQQMLFQNELDEIIELAKKNGRAEDPLIRQRIAKAWMGLRIQRYNALRMLSAKTQGPESTIIKIFWASWHRELGKLAMDVLGPEAEVAEGPDYQLSALQRMFLFTRADTIYGGSNQIQRNIISERALGMPREPRPA